MAEIVPKEGSGREEMVETTSDVKTWISPSASTRAFDVGLYFI